VHYTHSFVNCDLCSRGILPLEEILGHDDIEESQDQYPKILFNSPGQKSKVTSRSGPHKIDS